MNTVSAIKNYITTLCVLVFLTFTQSSTGQQVIELQQNIPTGLPRTGTASENTAIEKHVNTPTRPFAFGVEAGATMDFSGTESSHFDIDIYGGYRKGVIQTLGMGIGFHPTLSHNRTLIPIYILFRCNFKERQSLCFADIKAGMSINELSNDTHNTGLFTSAGIGFNLLHNHRFKIHAIVGYNYTQIVPFGIYTHNALHGASIRIGITF